MGSLALRTVCALFLLLHSVEGSNSTATDTTPKYTGWQKGPAERGTMTILWSCLTTVFACTWTILHLNVPARFDRTWKKILRKTKWMVITVVFPEFIFAKAVCELQMAIEDLHDLKEQENAFGREVEYGRGCRLLYRLFHPYTTSTSRSPARVRTWRRWTLKHCYFANMGGIYRQDPSIHPGSQDELLTAHALAKCCVPNKHSPIDDFDLTKEEISDKSKADNLVKTVAALQILWLVVSVITRKAYDLPISLLEVCTVAFAALSVATYVANLAKPKDIDIPVILKKRGRNHKNNSDESSWLLGESFFARSANPTKQHSLSGWTPRVRNDMLRLQAHGTQHLTLTYALAVSTMCFGAIHCAAWQNYFPSQVEMRLWQVASVLSTTLPLTNLLALATSNIIMGRKAHKVITTVESLMNSPTQDPSGTTREPDRTTGMKRVSFWWINYCLCVQNEDGFMETPDGSSLRESLIALLKVRNGIAKGEPSRAWCTTYLWSLNEMCKIGSKTVYELVDIPDDASVSGNYVAFRERIERSPMTEEAMPLVIEAINSSHISTAKLHTQWNGLTTTVDRLSTILAYISGLLYITARLILLAVAFAAFRKQDERLYVDTWARFLPSIG